MNGQANPPVGGDAIAAHRWIGAAAALLALTVGAGAVGWWTDGGAPPVARAASGCTPSVPGLTDSIDAPATRRFTLVAGEVDHSPRPGLTLPAWGFNGTVPGPQLRVRQGDRVEVTVCVETPAPLSVHWHGYPVTNEMDGVPGLTQNAIRRGGSMVYAFDAAIPGTYWYHSHQESTLQVDKGLYGALVVLPRDPGPDDLVDVDHTLVLADRQGAGAGPADLSDLETVRHALMQAVGLAPSVPLTVNGKTFETSPPIEVQAGQRVRLRLINAGTDRHRLQLGGHRYRLAAVDGQPLDGATETDELLEVFPAQRADVVFTADRPGTWTLRARDSVGPAAPVAVVRYAGYPDQPGAEDAGWAGTGRTLDLATYGRPPDKGAVPPDRPDLRPIAPAQITRRLALEITKDGDRYALREPGASPGGPAFDHLHPSLRIGLGEVVELTVVNRVPSGELHPMHLHGLHFQVLAVGGESYRGASVWRDTLNLRPRETAVVAFRADAPGAWMLQCHVLRHHAQGLGTVFLVGDAEVGFEPGGEHGNIPE